MFYKYEFNFYYDFIINVKEFEKNVLGFIKEYYLNIKDGGFLIMKILDYYLFGIYFYRKKVGLVYVYIFLNVGEEGEIYCDNCLLNGLKFFFFDFIEDDKFNYLKELMVEWIKKMNINYILKMVCGNIRRYLKSKENGR